MALWRSVPICPRPGSEPRAKAVVCCAQDGLRPPPKTERYAAISPYSQRGAGRLRQTSCGAFVGAVFRPARIPVSMFDSAEQNVSLGIDFQSVLGKLGGQSRPDHDAWAAN